MTTALTIAAIITAALLLRDAFRLKEITRKDRAAEEWLNSMRKRAMSHDPH